MLQARDLSTNFMAGVDASSNTGGESKPGLDEHGKEQPEAPRPKGAPNRFFYCFLFILGTMNCFINCFLLLFLIRAKHPPGGASHGPLW